MPIEETTIINISCDNPDCPGNDLDPHDRIGWTFISSEVYGQMSNEMKVYCCPMCAGHVTAALEANEAARLEESPPMEMEMPMDERPPVQAVNEGVPTGATADGEPLSGPVDKEAVLDVSGLRSDQDGHVVPTGDTGSTDPVQ